VSRRAARIGRRDLIDEALAGVLARPGRLLLTALGAALGLASVVATLGLAQTASNQVARQFDAIAATQVSVTARTSAGADGQPQALAPMPWDAEQRVLRLNGVVAAGTITSLATPPLVSSVPVVDPSGDSSLQLPIVAASPGLFAAVRAELGAGRAFDRGHDDRGDPVVVLGANVAARLHINRVDQAPTIFLGARPFSVVGIIDDVVRHGELLDAVIVPQRTAMNLFALPAPTELQIRTAQGAAALVGRQAPIALAPGAPDTMAASVPPSAASLRDKVQSEVNALFLVLGGVALLAGAVGIANVTLLSVLERIGEIGLRRALGATRRNVAAQFLMESSVVGFLGGLLGACAGIIVTLIVSQSRQWTPVLDLRFAFAAPAAGMAIGVLAGAFPAWRASAIEPITALRAG
jgi:putative ABC transport system permease protein